MVEPPLPTWTKKVPVSLLPSASFTVYWMASLPCQPAFGLNRMVPSLENETVPPAALSEATEVTLSRSEERRVGKGCVRRCRSRWSQYHEKKKIRKHDIDN